MAATRLLIIHTSELVREGLPTFLDNREGIEVVAICANGHDAINKAKEMTPDVIIMDARLGKSEASQTIRKLSNLLPETKVLLLAHSKDPGDLLGIFKAGGAGYISEKSSLKDLIEAINFVKNGGVILSSPLAEKIIADFKQQDIEPAETICSDMNLTERERQVLCHLIKGASNKEIASTLRISNNTVKVHIRNIMEKLQVHTRLQATIKGRAFIVC